jgi:hypothetical protein
MSFSHELTSRAYRVPTLVGPFLVKQSPTEVGTLNTSNQSRHYLGFRIHDLAVIGYRLVAFEALNHPPALTMGVGQ